ncbi:tetratricopeptide repeat protein (macronuclear) [Tetrahymena thermophila SB210]|uniref:Tetratricopeptide repeat protein n=1 Tax=Tetrahymena thermophila (strain SB210) TaxID=312017 RepID=I7M1P2_TETTS|nr:tetratricopeptide repeat protein [Tetrahymena thermophila SB210]EAR97278.2 tetratricopeptide repeat protein [Tetrahymena thermophila SB210]|eukprot:XP_001017523.2 tetratricopeptide repeat protein [Tetrahymena thermophila SB210]
MGQTLKYCSSVPNDRDGREAMLNVYPNIDVRQKLNNDSSRFSQIYSTKLENDQIQFILSLKPYSYNETEEVIKVDLKIKKDLFSLFLDRTYEWNLEEYVVKDFNDGNKIIARAQDKRTNERFTLQTIPFDDYEDYEFKAALYQIYIQRNLQTVSNGLPHPNIIQIKDAYIIESKEKTKKARSLIIVMEYFDSNLHDIIQFRKKHKWEFSTKELCSFLRDISSALATILRQGVSHRDIRPTNIWYVAQEKSYKIGGFQEARFDEKMKHICMRNQGVRHEDGEGYNTVRGVPQFAAPEILNLMHMNANQKVLNYNPFSQDIYSLGLTLILMKNLYDEVDFDTLLSKVKQSGSANINIDLGSMELNQLVDQMVNKYPQRRINAIQLEQYSQRVYPIEDYPKINENNLIISLNYKHKKISEQEYLLNQELLAKEYFNMLDFDQWIYKYDEIISSHEAQGSNLAKAETLQKIGEGYLILNDVYRAKDYFMKASVIFNEEGHECRKRSQLEGAIRYYEIAIECVRKGNNGEDTSELALLLENIGNIYKMKGDFPKARAFQEEALQIILIQVGEKSVEAARLYNNLGNLYASLGLYKKADKRLKKALKIVDNLYVSAEEQAQLKALCLCSLGEIHRLRGNLENSLEFLEEALEIREQVFGSGHIELASNCENLGNVYFDLGDFHKAKKFYERALVIKKSSLPKDSPEIALTLNNLGNVCKSQKEIEKAKKCYEECLQILYTKFGQETDNPTVATSLGNLGLVYKELGSLVAAQSNLQKCLEILAKSVGEDHPDFIFFQKHLYRLNQRINNSQYASSAYQSNY